MRWFRAEEVQYFSSLPKEMALLVAQKLWLTRNDDAWQGLVVEETYPKKGDEGFDEEASLSEDEEPWEESAEVTSEETQEN